MRANTQVFSQKPTELKNTDKTAKRRAMAQQAENGRKKLTISCRSHEPIELLQKRKDLPVQTYQKVFYPKA